MSFVLLAVLLAGAAAGQSRPGPFLDWNPWWTDPTFLGNGIRWDGSSIVVDPESDGQNVRSFARPGDLPTAALGSLRLTPSHEIVYAAGGGCGPGPNGISVYFYRVPTFGSFLQPLLSGLCIANGIDRVRFYDTKLCLEPNGAGLGMVCDFSSDTSPQRIAYFATPAATAGFENLVFVDLNSAAVSGAFNYDKNLGFVYVSPAGTQAFVQHDLGTPGETDYRLVDLCPGTLGQVINAGGFPLLNRSQVLAAEVTAVGGGTVTIEVGPTSGPATTSFDLSDCFDAVGACCGDSFGCVDDTQTAQVCGSYGTGFYFLGAGSVCSECPVPPPIEACCFDSGATLCSHLTNAECTTQGGNPQVGEPFCQVDTCPFPDPMLSVSGPTSGDVGDILTYTLDYSNAGGLPAPGVEVQVQIPFNTLFEDASNGGTFDGSSVRWMLGDLAPGASGSLSFSFSVDCLAANQSTIVRGLIAYLGGPFVPSNDLPLDIGAAASGSLTIAVTGTPERDPLLASDELEHIITLTNAGPDPIPDVAVQSSSSFGSRRISYGDAMTFDRVVDAAGGVVDSSGGEFDWAGDVPAASSIAIRFVTAVDACVAPSADTTSLNAGISVAAFDQCGVLIGESAAPPAFAIARLVDVSLAATNLDPPQRLDTPLFDVDVQVARPNASASFLVSISSNTGALPGAALSAVLRGIDVTAPPSEPGASYDSVNKLLAWTGTIPAVGSVDIHLTGSLTACRGEIFLDGASSPMCASMKDIQKRNVVAGVPAPPNRAWLAGLVQRPSPFGGAIEDHIVQIEPGPPVQVITMTCLPTEYSIGMGASADGDVWVGSLPTYRINPSTLEFRPFDTARHRAAGLFFLQNIAVDPLDGSVYLAGNSADPMLPPAAKILRYDPVLDTLTSFYDDSSFATISELVVDTNGSIAAIASSGVQNMLVRIDPPAPADEVVLYVPPTTLVADVAIDGDGSYVVIEAPFGGNATPIVFDVDPTSGALTTLVADLRIPFPAPNVLWGQVEIAESGDLFLASLVGGLGQLDRSTPTVGQVLLPFTPGISGITDLAMVPEPGPDALAIAALAAVAGLGALRRRRLGR